MKPASVPEATVQYFASGEHCQNTRPGDLILVDHVGPLPSLIRAGQRIKYWWRRRVLRRPEYRREYCGWNHAMVIIEGGLEARAVEMTARGGEVADLLEYKYRRYAVVSPTHTTSKQREIAAAMARWSVGIEYGWLSILGLVLDVFIPVIEVAVGSGQRMICSTASSLAHRALGLIPDRADPAVMPADLARYYDARGSLCR